MRHCRPLARQKDLYRLPGEYHFLCKQNSVMTREARSQMALPRLFLSYARIKYQINIFIIKLFYNISSIYIRCILKSVNLY